MSNYFYLLKIVKIHACLYCYGKGCINCRGYGTMYQEILLERLIRISNYDCLIS